MKDRVAIIGYTSHKALAAYEDPDVDLYGLNDLYIDLPVLPDTRWTWFQIHEWSEGRPVESVVDLTGGPVHPRDPSHVKWLADAAKHIPVYLREPRAEVPDARVFPFQETYEYFGRYLKRQPICNYFTNSISFMVGHAIMAGYKEIGVYGVDMMVGGKAAGSEYGWQRPSVEWILGIAMGMGIVVDLPDESDLLKTAYPYGDASASMFRRKVASHLAELKQRQTNLNNQAQGMHNARMEIAGACNVLEWLSNAWMPGDSDVPSAGTAPQPNAHVQQASAAVAGRIAEMQEQQLVMSGAIQEPKSDGDQK